MTHVLIVDYGLSNLHSVQRAFEKLGATVEFVQSVDSIRKAERIVLPGVGAFGVGMHELTQRGLVEPLRDYIATGRPFLGICVGMQLMFSRGEENGNHVGLGLLKGAVCRLDRPEQTAEKIPHVGWSPLRSPFPDGEFHHPLLDGVHPGEAAYFVHSYAGFSEDCEDIVAEAEFGSANFAAIVGRGRAVGCQFHPEKSGKVGLKILSNFLAL